MQGRRVSVNLDSYLPESMQPGDYGQDKDGLWWCMTPNGLVGLLSGHAVSENEDGTITVSPSILVKDSTASYHGFLEHGVWIEV